MKQKVVLDSFWDSLDVLEIGITEHQKQLLENYVVHLLDWSARINLVSRKTLNSIPETHLVPAIFLAQHFKNISEATVIDIGSGAGLPGIVLKIIRPDLKITLLDSIKKKTNFLAETSDRLGLELTVINDRIENHVRSYKENYQVVTARGVASLKMLADWAQRLLEKRGYLMAIKGGISEQWDANGGFEIVYPPKNWIREFPGLENKYIVRMSKK